MVRIFELKLPFDHPNDALAGAIASALGIAPGDLEHWEIRRQAIDARRKTNIYLVYTVDCSMRPGVLIRQGPGAHKISPPPDESYRPPEPGAQPLHHRPVIAGSGPSGLFAGLILAQGGYRPIILERGKPVADRWADVQRFWNEGVLDPESNAQFGEGGAGTFSDGKLTTNINDPRCRKVLDELIAAGAPAAIGISARPYIGTDRLRAVVAALRQAICKLGGDVRFGQRLTGLRCAGNALTGIDINGCGSIDCEVAVLAIGHSARDTYAMLHAQGVRMVPKGFSIGMRIEHPQELIDRAQFGKAAGHPRLGPAEYKMAFHAPGGRSAYTFCMCPGGEVIAAASHTGCVVTNGMSLQARNGPNANAALQVNVEPADFPCDHPLAGLRFQEQWEQAAFALTGKSYAAPAQKLADFIQCKPSAGFGRVLPTYRPGVVPADLGRCLPAHVCDTLRQAIPAFARQVRGFDLPDAVLSGVETRSSSPVRIKRGEDFQSVSCGGLYPAGEGAGYAGGIMSAAVDGIKVAEAIIERFAAPAF